MGTNQEQQDFWSTEAGQKWVRYQHDMDRLFVPVLQLVLDKADLKSGETVLDVGCAAGTSTARAAQLVGPNGHCTGVDISDTLLDHAVQTIPSENTTFLLADAQTHEFESATYDAMISRFGVMFFADTIAAFSNIKSSLKPNGRITMAAWGPAPDNPWFMLPAQAARSQLGSMPKVDRSLPGPFAFENHSRVLLMLEKAGFEDAQVETHSIALTAGGGLDQIAHLCCEIGPADSILGHFEGTPKDRDAIEKRIADLFRPFETKDELRIPASIHVFTARAD